MNEVNPYAAPMADTPFLGKPMMDGGIYHAHGGNLLVIDKRAVLPTEICIKSNMKATRELRRKLNWHHPAVFLALLANILIYAILAMIMTKKATITIGLTDEWYARRHRRMLIAWIGVFACFGAGVFAVTQGIDAPRGGEIWLLVMLGGFFGFLGFAIFGLISCRLVNPSKITDSHVFLKGANPEFARRFPQWQGDI